VAFEVLSAEKDASRWTELVNALPSALRDIHFLPEYGLIYREAYGYQPLLAVFQGEQGSVIQPFVQRPLGGLPFLADSTDRDRFTDIANPYGFGGPLSSVTDPAAARELYRRFADEFAAWCDQEGMASEFAVLHPLFADHQRSLLQGVIETRHEKDVVVVDLAGEVRSGLNRGQQSNVNKAAREGVVVSKVEPSSENLATFRKLYISTMERRQAAERWFVPERYFADCCRLLGPQRSSLFFATIGGKVECGYLLIHDFETAYYFFAGSLGAFPDHKANNLTMLETALWAKDNGYRRYFLGGGVTSDPEDSLLRFKAGFSGLRVPLYTYFCVRNRAAYDELSDRKRAFERKTMNAESTSDFLPLYRR
jgi:hypothetical protein